MNDPSDLKGTNVDLECYLEADREERACSDGENVPQTVDSALVCMNQQMREPAYDLLDELETLDEVRVLELLQALSKKTAVPDNCLIRPTQQARYLADVEEHRVRAVYLLRPFWMDFEDELKSNVIHNIQEAGYTVLARGHRTLGGLEPHLRVSVGHIGVPRHNTANPGEGSAIRVFKSQPGTASAVSRDVSIPRPKAQEPRQLGSILKVFPRPMRPGTVVRVK